MGCPVQARWASMRPRVAPGVLVQPSAVRRSRSAETMAPSLPHARPKASSRSAARAIPPSRGAHKRPPGAARLVRATNGLAVPERQSRGASRRRFHDNPVGTDLLDARCSCRGDDVAHPRLHHHLLVQLAHVSGPDGRRPPAAPPRTCRGRGGGRRRYGPGRCEPGRGVGSVSRSTGSRRELSHLARTVTPLRHVEHSLEGAPAQIGVAGRPPHAGKPIVGWKAVRRHGHGGHGLLGQRPARVAHETRAL